MTLNTEAKKFIKDYEEIVYLFSKERQYLDEEDKAVAKLVEVRENGKQSGTYYIRSGQGDLYDPYGPYELSRSILHLYPFTKVPKTVFDLYMKYLKEKKSGLLTQARREYMSTGRH